jgi:uncharacterized membrane protein YdjX (TVP38/TMEM64 family)
MSLEIIGLIGLFFVMVLQVVIPPIPAELIVISAASIYGWKITGLISGLGLFVGSILVYHIGVKIKGKWGAFFSKEKVKKIIFKIKRYDSLILWIRILPYNPSDIISYAAGIMHFEKKRFYSISFITSFVRCFLLALLGSFVNNLKSLIYVFLINFNFLIN